MGNSRPLREVRFLIRVNRARSEAMRGYILVQADPRANGHELARTIARIPGVDRAEHVTGGFDVIAQVGGSVLDRTVLSRVHNVPGVLRALPLPLPGAVIQGSGLEAFQRAG
jgi:hypothetical protein